MYYIVYKCIVLHVCRLRFHVSISPPETAWHNLHVGPVLSTTKIDSRCVKDFLVFWWCGWVWRCWQGSHSLICPRGVPRGVISFSYSRIKDGKSFCRWWFQAAVRRFSPPWSSQHNFRSLLTPHFYIWYHKRRLSSTGKKVLKFGWWLNDYCQSDVGRISEKV